MELSKPKHSALLDYKVLVRIFVIAAIMYFLYIMTYTPNTSSIIILPMSIQDSPYLTPEGWPLPYPYVAPTSN